MREQVADRHRAIGCTGGVVGVFAAGQHLEIAPLGDEARDGVAELKHPAFVQLHEGDGGDRLGHRVDAEDGVFGHRLVALAVQHAERGEVGEFAAAGDQRDAAGDPAGFDVAAEQVLVEALQGLDRDAGRRRP